MMKVVCLAFACSSIIIDCKEFGFILVNVLIFLIMSFIVMQCSCLISCRSSLKNQTDLTDLRLA